MANESRKRHNDETLEFATNHKLLWDGTDLAYLNKHLMEHDHSTALELGRTYEAVQSKRHAIKLFKEGAIAVMPERQRPITLNDALEERIKQIAEGVRYPTIKAVPGGYVVGEGRLASEVQGGKNG